MFKMYRFESFLFTNQIEHGSPEYFSWLRSDFGVAYLREKRKDAKRARKAIAKKARIDAAHAHVEVWLDAMHRHEDPLGVWLRENDTRHDYLETAD
jgi:hypothetical protein